MKLYTKEIIAVLNEVLEDDATEFGGTSMANETVEDFLYELEEEKMPQTLDELNNMLYECGIKPIEVKEN